MSAEITIFDIMKAALVIASPFILLEGVFLLFLNQNSYERFETVLGREFGLKTRMFPKIESNIYVFYNWILKNKTQIGLLCVLCAILFFLANK